MTILFHGRDSHIPACCHLPSQSREYPSIEAVVGLYTVHLSSYIPDLCFRSQEASLELEANAEAYISVCSVKVGSRRIVFVGVKGMGAGSPAPVEMEELGRRNSKGKCPRGVSLRRCPWEWWVRKAWLLSLHLSLCWSHHLILAASISLVTQSVRHLSSQVLSSLFLSGEISDQQITSTTLQSMCLCQALP